MRFPGEKRSHRLQRGTQQALHHSTQRRLRQPCARVRVRRRTGAPGEQKSLKPSHLSGPASAMAACADLQPAGRPRRLRQRATRRRSGADERRAAGRSQAHWGLRSFASPRTRLAAARPGTPATAAGLYGAHADSGEIPSLLSCHHPPPVAVRSPPAPRRAACCAAARGGRVLPRDVAGARSGRLRAAPAVGARRAALSAPLLTRSARSAA
jgi:hypothetical protein